MRMNLLYRIRELFYENIFRSLILNWFMHFPVKQSPIISHLHVIRVSPIGILENLNVFNIRVFMHVHLHVML